MTANDEALKNHSQTIFHGHNKTTTPVEEFWEHRVLQQNQGLEFGLGSVQWELAGCLLVAWVCVYLIIWKGLHSSGKVFQSLGSETFDWRIIKLNRLNQIAFAVKTLK